MEGGVPLETGMKNLTPSELCISFSLLTEQKSKQDTSSSVIIMEK